MIRRKHLVLTALLLLSGCIDPHSTINTHKMYVESRSTNFRIDFRYRKVTPLRNSCATSSCHPAWKMDSSNYSVHPNPEGPCPLTYQERQQILVRTAPKAINPYERDSNK